MVKMNIPLAKSDSIAENGQFMWNQGLVNRCLRIYLGS
ncbi:hypothetical protein UF75_4522 [Desulfosporosinus sp. I2]|nr:hypothetical protein UF75_4522 [Desulfosporosinus sp. I2]